MSHESLFFILLLEFGQAVFQRSEFALVIGLEFGFWLDGLIFIGSFAFRCFSSRCSLAFFRSPFALDGFADGLELLVRNDEEADWQVSRSWRHDADGHIRPSWEGIDVFHSIRVIEAHRVAMARQFDDFLVFAPLGTP